MRLVQLRTANGPRVAVVESRDQLRLLDFPGGTYELASRAIELGIGLSALIEQHYSHTLVDYKQAIDRRELLPPVTHPDRARCTVTGTGLTHLGSADTRDAMHAAAQAQDDASLTDSMRMFRLGLEGGKPAEGQVGAQPEWFYKGDPGLFMRPT